MHFKLDNSGNNVTKVGSLPSEEDNEAEKVTSTNKETHSFISTQESKCCCLSNHQNEAFNHETIFLNNGKPNQLRSTVTNLINLRYILRNQINVKSTFH